MFFRTQRRDQSGAGRDHGDGRPGRRPGDEKYGRSAGSAYDRGSRIRQRSVRCGIFPFAGGGGHPFKGRPDAGRHGHESAGHGSGNRVRKSPEYGGRCRQCIFFHSVY